MTFPVSGFVLAGGKSSRMGTDKALLELGGRTLAELAVDKLRAVCGEVFLLSGNEALAGFAPLVGDLHPGCGPMGGMEAGLARAETEWTLFLAVDMPFVPAALLEGWVPGVLGAETARVALFTAGGVAQPTLTMVHREVGPFVAGAVARGEYKLVPLLFEAAGRLAGELGVPVGAVLRNEEVDEVGWFANLNTPGEFAAAAGGWVLEGVSV